MKTGKLRAWLLKVVKKLWGYIKRNRVIINITVVVKNEQAEKIDATVEMKEIDAGESWGPAFEATVKLRTFKAVEPDL